MKKCKAAAESQDMTVLIFFYFFFSLQIDMANRSYVSRFKDAVHAQGQQNNPMY